MAADSWVDGDAVHWDGIASTEGFWGRQVQFGPCGVGRAFQDIRVSGRQLEISVLGAVSMNVPAPAFEGQLEEEKLAGRLERKWSKADGMLSGWTCALCSRARGLAGEHEWWDPQGGRFWEIQRGKDRLTEALIKQVLWIFLVLPALPPPLPPATFPLIEGEMTYGYSMVKS